MNIKNVGALFCILHYEKALGDSSSGLQIISGDKVIVHCRVFNRNVSR